MIQHLALAAALVLAASAAAPIVTPVHFAAGDGVVVYGTAYAARPPAIATILLFHQAGSSKSEYLPIAPRLAALGYNVLAIDQRSGGDLYSPPNETVLHLGKSTPYPDVLKDMDAAVDFARQRFPKSSLYAWGSSYSAGLVFALAAEHPHDIAAVLAFSPNEYFDDKRFVRDAARGVTVPVFVDSAADKNEEDGAREILDAASSQVKVDYVPTHGIHGSSTLRDDRDPAGAAENWDAVTNFLKRISKQS